MTPQKVYAGDVPYQTSNGWHITVFNDANEWDYVEEIRTQGGDTLDFDDLDKTPLISAYVPSDETAWTRIAYMDTASFGVPGAALGSQAGHHGPIPLLCPSCQRQPPTAVTKSG